MSKLQKISDKKFIEVVKNNYCVRDVVGSLGYSRASGAMAFRVKERISKMNLDISHFKGRNCKSCSNPKYSLEEILVENSTYENTTQLKKRIIKENLKEYKCEQCGNKGEWNGQKLVLQLEHKNGIHNDHRLENLCFLCPNCHSQTKTFAGKNIGKYSN